jgi:DNA repair photolyase
MTRYNRAQPIPERLKALDELHSSGIRTYAMIAPMLPVAEDLPNYLEGKVDYILLDRKKKNRECLIGPLSEILLPIKYYKHQSNYLNLLQKSV